MSNALQISGDDKRATRRPARRARRSQAERRENTQNSVLNAAIKVLLKRGYANFTTAEVAQIAGVSRGAQMNYFRTRDDLVLATGRYTLSRSTEEAIAFAEKSVSTRSTLTAFLENAERFFLGENYTAMMEVTVAARTDPRLAREIVSLLTQYRRTLNDIWIDAFTRAGYDRKTVVELIKLTNHIYRGMALTAVWAQDKGEDRKLRSLWGRMAKELLEKSRR